MGPWEFFKLVITFGPELFDLIKHISALAKEGVTVLDIRRELRGLAEAYKKKNSADRSAHINTIFRT